MKFTRLMIIAATAVALNSCRSSRGDFGPGKLGWLRPDAADVAALERAAGRFENKTDGARPIAGSLPAPTAAGLRHC